MLRVVTQTTDSVHASGTYPIGEDLTVHRLGFGAMRITGDGVWGEPKDRDECIRVLRRAVELGVDLIDTADSYGPYVSEDLIREALFPYQEGLVIATKGGLTRSGPAAWGPVGRPAYLRQCVEMSLRRLGLERIDLYQLHRVDPATPMEESLGELKAMQREGKIRHIGVSEVDVATIEEMRKIVDVVSVQNLYNLTDRHHEEVVDYCDREGIGFIPWYPLATGALAGDGGPLARIAERHSASASQLALAWLLRRSPVVMPIPGTSSVSHLEENCAGAAVELSDEEYAELAAL
jgi:aryl-alcohol dehydrogenase-like predicted oxidoreductase